MPDSLKGRTARDRQAAGGASGFRKDAERFLAAVDACACSEEGLRRAGEALGDRGLDPMRRRDAMLAISAAELRGADLEPAAEALARAAGDDAMPMRPFASGLLARHLMRKGDFHGACSLYLGSGPNARRLIMLEAGSWMLSRGYDSGMETLSIHILTDPDERIASRFLSTLLACGRSDPALAAMLIAASTDFKSEKD